jgi:hypothetical protein
VLTEDVTVIAWVNPEPQVPVLLGLDPQTSDGVKNGLLRGPNCALTTLGWVDAGNHGTVPGSESDVNNDIDRRYANAYLNWGTGNDPPPDQIPPANLIQMPRLFRIYSRFQASYDVSAGVIDSPQYHISLTAMGHSLEPCSGFQLDLFRLLPRPMQGSMASQDRERISCITSPRAVSGRTVRPLIGT